MNKFDLHIHSNFSDGSDSISVLVENIINSDIKTFALTDHDTVDGIYEIENYITPDTNFIRGVELTCLGGDLKSHILGYYINPDNEKLQTLLKKGKELRRQKLETRIQYMRDVLNINLTEDELSWLYSRKSVVKTHLANILVNRGMAKTNVEAMKKYLDNIKTGNTRFELSEAIDAIKSANGIVVWAHPLGGEGEVHIKPKEFMPQLEYMINTGIQGLECYYSRYNLDEIKFLKECANNNKLYISGGSDYHGSNKENIHLAKLNTENITIYENDINIVNAK